MDPADFCTLNPSGLDFWVHVCSGKVTLLLRFDYYGDPDLLDPIKSFAICSDDSNKDPPKGPGYLATCLTQLSEYEFGPGIKHPNGEQVDVCCLRESPDEAVTLACHYDLAEEVCQGTSDGLNELRKEIPWVLMELNDQLEALNMHIAEGSTQTECATEMVEELLDTDDPPLVAKADWAVDDDPQWSWFRRIDVNVGDFSIVDSEFTGKNCLFADPVEPMSGKISGGKLKVKSLFGNANVDVEGGAFSFRTADCLLETCDFDFETFSVDVSDFEVGPLAFSDVHAEMIEPALGQINEPRVGISRGEMRFDASFRAEMNDEPLFDGEVIHVQLSNTGVAEARLTPGPLFGVSRVEAVNWPFELRLKTNLAPCD